MYHSDDAILVPEVPYDKTLEELERELFEQFAIVARVEAEIEEETR